MSPNNFHPSQMNFILSRPTPPAKGCKGRACIHPFQLKTRVKTKKAFALTEVLVSFMILGVCASMIAPYFKNMYTSYQRIRDKMRCEYIVEEALATTYTTYLTNPPTYDEIIRGITSENIFDGFTISCSVTKNLQDEDSSEPICTGIVTMQVRKETAVAEGSMELCFQKSTL